MANSPIENLMYDLFVEKINNYINKTNIIIKNILKESNRELSYYSKKFLTIYLLLAFYDIENNISSTVDELILEPLDCNIFEEIPNENLSLRYIISMLDFIPVLSQQKNSMLSDLILKFYSEIEDDLNLSIITKESLLEEIYNFIYRQYFINIFNYLYDDKLVKDTDYEYPEISQAISMHKRIIEKPLNIKFNHEQLSSLTLIFVKWIAKNKLLETDRKKIIISTNVSNERIDFFVERLHSFINFEYVTVLNINEIHKFNDFDFDLIITFSNRMTNVLNRYEYYPIQVNFFIENIDLLKLFEAGCEIASNKLVASKIIEEVSTMNKVDAENLLRKKYGDIFL